MEDGSERKLSRRTVLKGAAAAAAIPIAAAVQLVLVEVVAPRQDAL